MQARTLGLVAAAAAMVAVGSGITVSDDLVGYPVYTAQAIRYALAAIILALGLRATGRSIPRPRGRDWIWLLLLAATGQALFNVAIVWALAEAEPAAVAVLIGSVPLVLMIAEAIQTRGRPAPLMIVGVVVVVVGAALVQGGGRTSLSGILWALLALACEAAFTLLAVPILGRLGPYGVSTHSCWIAAIQLAIVALIVDGTNALPALTGNQTFAIGYLAVVLTAVAFVLWYTAVERIGPATAGLFAGLIPVSAALTGLIPGLTTITAMVIGGTALVGAGISVGLASGRTTKPELQDH
ncbi:MAG: DMT family transporter [Actinobacteria bacterium]|nr:DMT family transporter [Actinomycetota bacterium]